MTLKNLTYIALFALLCAPVPGRASPCQPGAELSLPATAILRQEAIGLSILPIRATTAEAVPGFGTQAAAERYRQVITAHLAEQTPAARDALLLALLDWLSTSTLPTLRLTAFAPAGMLDEFVAVLDQHGPEEVARALRDAQAAYPVWGDDIGLRYDQWSDGRGGIQNPSLDRVLRDTSARLQAAKPQLLATAWQVAQGDPAFVDRINARMTTAGDEPRLRFMMEQIGSCVGAAVTAAELAAALAALPQPQADLLVLWWFLQESGNGGVHQYIFNSTGDLAPDLLRVLRRLGLTGHADAIKAELVALFGADYPRDTQARRALMAGFSPAQDQALHDLTGWSDDGAVFDALIGRAKETGLWPGVPVRR